MPFIPVFESQNASPSGDCHEVPYDANLQLDGLVAHSGLEKPKFTDLMRKSPLVGIALDFSRANDSTRQTHFEP
jgi:hypothetical protein